MRDFETREEAIRYIDENFSKTEWEVANVNGKRSFLCATAIPLEQFLRNDIEAMVTEFLSTMGIEDDGNEIAIEIGADVSSIVEERLINLANIDVICNYEDY